jgi:serine/threonine protein kinase
VACAAACTVEHICIPQSGWIGAGSADTITVSSVRTECRTGETLSHYRILEKIGEGGASVVYKAEDLALGRAVALKLLPADLSSDYAALARFQHEARTASSLNHPNLCTIYEVSDDGGQPFVVMELLEGEVLSRIIGGRPIDPYRSIELGVQMADALDAAHAEGIIHRDVKPANTFVTSRDQIKLLDFGLAVLIPSYGHGNKTVDSQWLGSTGGTIPFMSPEQVRGEALDTRTDLFSLGVVLYEMLTGRRPFLGSNPAAIKESIENQSPLAIRDLNPSIPAEFERIVGKALEKNRKLRFQTASDLRADLQRLKRDLDSRERVLVPVSAGRPAIDAGPSRWRSWRVVSASASLALVVGALVGARTARRFGPISQSAPSISTASRPPVMPLSAVRPPSPGVDAKSPVDKSGNAPKKSPPAPPVRTDARRGPTPAGTSWADQELRIAKTKFDLKLYDQAVDTLHDLVVREPDNPTSVEAYFLMAAVRQQQARVEDAMSTYLEIVDRYPDDVRAPEALFHLGEQMLRSKRPNREADARAVYARTATRYPDSPWAARALMARADLEERQEVWERDAMLATSVPAALVTYRQVVEHYGARPEAERARWKLGLAYVSAKRYELAAATFVDLATAFPGTSYDAWFAAGELYEKKLKDPARAVDAYSRVAATSPRFKDAQKRLGR